MASRLGITIKSLTANITDELFYGLFLFSAILTGGCATFAMILGILTAFFPPAALIAFANNIMLSLVIGIGVSGCTIAARYYLTAKTDAMLAQPHSRAAELRIRLNDSIGAAILTFIPLGIVALGIIYTFSGIWAPVLITSTTALVFLYIGAGIGSAFVVGNTIEFFRSSFNTMMFSSEALLRSCIDVIEITVNLVKKLFTRAPSAAPVAVPASINSSYSRVSTRTGSSASGNIVLNVDDVQEDTPEEDFYASDDSDKEEEVYFQPQSQSANLNPLSAGP